MQIATTTMSVKGQVVIPKDLREEAGLKEADKLMVYATPGSVIIKKMSKEEAWKELERLLEPIRAEVKRKGITRKDIDKEIHEYRKEKREKSASSRKQ